MSIQDQIEQLRTSLLGELIEPGDADYDDARALYNGMIDKRPRLIARCRDAADVRNCVLFAGENNFLLAIRGGGHNGPGLGSCNGGLVIDCGPMKSVRVDPRARTVRVGPGCTQGEMDHATHAYGLHVPAGIVSSTGVAGLTLGGGHGYLTRKHGLTIDNLVEVDVVLADGSFVTANETQHPDLFWAIRGGGGNFGVVTSFVYRAHPVKFVYAGPIFYDVQHTKAIMQWYREFIKTAPEELFTFIGLKTVPSTDPFPKEIWGRRICAVISCYNGPTAEALEAIRPIREELPEPLMDAMDEMPFTVLQGLFDPLLPKGLQWYWKGDYVRELSDEAIDVHVEYANNMPSDMSLMHLYPIDGAVHRVPVDATAWSCRDAQWSMVIAGVDPEPANAGAITAWARKYWEAIHPYSHDGVYVNFMMDDEGEDRIRATYGPNYERLVAVKEKYDPTNLFRVNQNIRPRTAARREERAQGLAAAK
jgi:FAD/FMN-containing dehydrogenase